MKIKLTYLICLLCALCFCACTTTKSAKSTKEPAKQKRVENSRKNAAAKKSEPQKAKKETKSEGEKKEKVLAKSIYKYEGPKKVEVDNTLLMLRNMELPYFLPETVYLPMEFTLLANPERLYNAVLYDVPSVTFAGIALYSDFDFYNNIFLMRPDVYGGVLTAVYYGYALNPIGVRKYVEPGFSYPMLVTGKFLSHDKYLFFAERIEFLFDGKHQIVFKNLKKNNEKQAEQSKPKEKSIGGFSLESLFYLYSESYQKHMADPIVKQWNLLSSKYNLSGVEGSKVEIDFKVNDKGEVVDLKIRSSTSTQDGAKLCEAAIRAAAPFEEWTERMRSKLPSPQTVKVNFFYH